MLRHLICALVLTGLNLGSALAAEPGPEECVRAHFLAISAEDYSAADRFFSEAFRRAFKGDFAAMDKYYLARRAQLSAGYKILSSEPLADTEHETARVTVDFNDPDPSAAITATERMYYYFIREKVESGSPLRDRDGRAWRIDICDALSYSTLAEARRRPYLYTREAWPEDESRELRASQGLYRVQQALESFGRVNGHYPLRLLGADNRRDELIQGKFLAERYPQCGFDDRPMDSVDFGIKSSGDLSYYSFDRDGDDKADGYYLLLHGKVAAHALFAGRDSILILADGYRADQPALCSEFAAWWEAQRGERLAPGPALEQGWPSSPAPADPTAALSAPEQQGRDSPPLSLDNSAAVEELLQPAVPAQLPTISVVDEAEQPGPMASVELAAAEPDSSPDGNSPPEPAAPLLPRPLVELIVHAWGFK